MAVTCVGVAGVASYAEGTGCPAGAVLAEGPITIDLDTTDVEVYDLRSTAGPARCTAPGPC